MWFTVRLFSTIILNHVSQYKTLLWRKSTTCIYQQQLLIASEQILIRFFLQHFAKNNILNKQPFDEWKVHLDFQSKAFAAPFVLVLYLPRVSWYLFPTCLLICSGCEWDLIFKPVSWISQLKLKFMFTTLSESSINSLLNSKLKQPEKNLFKAMTKPKYGYDSNYCSVVTLLMLASSIK